MKKEHLTFLHNQEEEINNNMKKSENQTIYIKQPHTSQEMLYWRSTEEAYI